MSFEQAMNGLVQWIVRLLPQSPFAPYVEQLAQLPYLGYINWFFPVGTCLQIMSAWLVAVAAFYLYSVMARWVKLIGS